MMPAAGGRLLRSGVFDGTGGFGVGSRLGVW
jgi:hypothetical protein